MTRLFVYNNLKSTGSMSEALPSMGGQMLHRHCRVEPAMLVPVLNNPMMMHRQSAISNQRFSVTGEMWELPQEAYNGLREVHRAAGLQQALYSITYYDTRAEMLTSTSPSYSLRGTGGYAFALPLPYGLVPSWVPSFSLSSIPDVEEDYGVSPDYRQVLIAEYIEDTTGPSRVHVHNAELNAPVQREDDEDDDGEYRNEEEDG